VRQIANEKRMAILRKERPDLFGLVVSGEMRFPVAWRDYLRVKVEDRTASLPPGKYRIIYADPPWQYKDKLAVSSLDLVAATSHYPTMSLEELCLMPVKDMAAPDSVLFLWATFPLLPDALEVVKSWGFTYKTAFVWDKLVPTWSNYHRAELEVLLIGTRGRGTPYVESREPQLWHIKKTYHSRKPEEFRRMIDRLYSIGPRIELFHRGEPITGWDTWGNESKKGGIG